MTDTSSTLPETPQSDQPSDQELKARRKKGLGIVAILIVIALVIYLIWSVFFNHSVSTDNA